MLKQLTILFAAVTTMHWFVPTAWAQDGPNATPTDPASGDESAPADPAPDSPTPASELNAPPARPPAPASPASRPPSQSHVAASDSNYNPIPAAQPAPKQFFYSAGASAGFSVLATGAGIGLSLYGLEQGSLGLFILGFAGMTIGPSAGHFYTREYKRAWLGVGLRAGALLLMIVSGQSDSEELGILAGYAFMGLGIYSLIDSPFSAWRANRRERARARQLTLTPAIIPRPGQRSAMGLALRGSF